VTIFYTGLVVRNERRVRLNFSEPLASGAFGPGSSVSSLYVIASVDGAGADPGISAAIAIPSAAGNVELALTLDLVAGGIYTVTTLSVPALAGSFSASKVDTFTFGALPAPNIDIEFPQDDIGSLVYGLDLVWTGADFLELPSGDLANVSGVPNVQGAMHRRLLDEDGLPWDTNYGAKSGEYVNGPVQSGGALIARLRRQAVADNRVSSATVSWTSDATSVGDNYFPVKINLRGASPGDGFTVNVNPQGTS
jgi:hypothetical protein